MELDHLSDANVESSIAKSFQGLDMTVFCGEYSPIDIDEDFLQDNEAEPVLEDRVQPPSHEGSQGPVSKNADELRRQVENEYKQKYEHMSRRLQDGHQQEIDVLVSNNAAKEKKAMETEQELRKLSKDYKALLNKNKAFASENEALLEENETFSTETSHRVQEIRDLYELKVLFDKNLAKFKKNVTWKLEEHREYLQNVGRQATELQTRLDAANSRVLSLEAEQRGKSQEIHNLVRNVRDLGKEKDGLEALNEKIAARLDQVEKRSGGKQPELKAFVGGSERIETHVTGNLVQETKKKEEGKVTGGGRFAVQAAQQDTVQKIALKQKGNVVNGNIINPLSPSLDSRKTQMNQPEEVMRGQLEVHKQAADNEAQAQPSKKKKRGGKKGQGKGLNQGK